MSRFTCVRRTWCIGVGSKPHGRSAIHACLSIINETVRVDLHTLDAIDQLGMQIAIYEFVAMERSTRCIASQ